MGQSTVNMLEQANALEVELDRLTEFCKTGEFELLSTERKILIQEQMLCICNYGENLSKQVIVIHYEKSLNNG